jgi:hypothetical protein
LISLFFICSSPSCRATSIIGTITVYRRYLSSSVPSSSRVRDLELEVAREQPFSPFSLLKLSCYRAGRTQSEKVEAFLPSTPHVSIESSKTRQIQIPPSRAAAKILSWTPANM